MVTRCILIEDELPAQNILKNYLAKVPNLELVAAFQSALEAHRILTQERIDLVFLDINLPDISGMQYVRTLVHPPKIIITTAYPGYAVESYELDTVCDYLVKPFSFERFLKAVNKVTGTWERQFQERKTTEIPTDFITVTVDKTIHRIRVSDILYIASDRNYVTLVTAKGKLSYIDSLRNWMEKLPNEQFIQAHKSFIVNCCQIKKITGGIILIDTHRIPLGRKYKAGLLKKMGL